jgi:uncharacterized lipoprotein YbaY
MIRRALLAGLALMLAGCAVTPRLDNRPALTGQALLDQPQVIGPDSDMTLALRLEDLSAPERAIGRVVSEAYQLVLGPPPIAFRIALPAGGLAPEKRYGLSIDLRSGGKVRFQTTAPVPVAASGPLALGDVKLISVAEPAKSP